MWAAVLPFAFAACSQEELVNNPNVTPEPAQEWQGVEVVENTQFSISKDDEGALTRMATTDGVIGWEEGDEVGLVWLNAKAISDNYTRGMFSFSDWYPTTPLHYSNTRITHDGNSIFSMEDGQLYAGQYIAYHPYDADMKQVGEFTLKQDSAQQQNTSAVVDDAAYDYLAKNMNWLSRSASNKTGKSSFLYHIDANKAGLVKTIHIPMRRYSNIFEARFTDNGGNKSSIEWKDLTITQIELIAENEIFPTKTRFHFNEDLGNGEYELTHTLRGYVPVESTEKDNNGNAIVKWENDAIGYESKFVVGLQQVGPTNKLPALQKNDATTGGEKWYENDEYAKSILLNIENPAIVGDNATAQRAMFLLLPTAVAELAEDKNAAPVGALSIKITTDYGYIIIPESEWKSYIGEDPDPVVNGTNWGSQYMFQDFAGLVESGKTATELLSLIGQKITRFVPVNTDNLVYNDIAVNSMDELLAAIDKWNKLGATGEFRVHVTKNNNNFKDFNWSTSSYAQINTFLNDGDNLKISVDLGTDNNGNLLPMNLSGATTLNDLDTRNSLTIEGAVKQADGTMTVLNDEVINNLIVAKNATLVVDEGEKLSGNTVELNGNSTINGSLAYNAVKNRAKADVNGTISAQTVYNSNSGTVMNIATKGKVEATKWVKNDGEMNLAQNSLVTTPEFINNKLITTNGKIDADTFNNSPEGDYHMKTFSETEVGTFTNEGEIYYDEQGASFKYTNVNGGKSIATVLEGAEPNTLADYILNANKFKCTDLIINPNDYFTTDQWDNSLNEVNLNFKNVRMNDGVTIKFNKDLSMKSALVTITEDATVVWERGATVDNPVFTISGVVVEPRATLKVSDVLVVNGKKTVVEIDGGTTTIDGMHWFAQKGYTELSSGSNGTIKIVDLIAEAMQNKEDIKLTGDLILSETLAFDYDCTIDLNGHTIKNVSADSNGESCGTKGKACAVFYVNDENVTVTIKGEGDVIAASPKANFNIPVWVRNGNVIIEGGNFFSGKTADGSASHAVYGMNSAKVLIKGGTFDAEGTIKGMSVVGVLNCKDYSQAQITLAGGKYYGFGPDEAAKVTPSSATQQEIVLADGAQWSAIDSEGYYAVK